MPSLDQLSVVLPVLNERDNLAELIPELITQLSPFTDSLEVIVVDDSSTDGTDVLLADLGRHDERVRYIPRSGRSASLPNSIADGIHAARFSHVVWLDADGSMPPTTVVELVNAYRTSTEVDPVVVGSRFVSGGGFKGVETVGETRWWQVVRNLRHSNDSIAAVLLSRILNRYLWFVLGRCCRDLASGFVVIRRDTALRLGFEGSYGDYCVRFIYLAHRSHHRIIEVPYVCLVRRHGYSKTGTTLVGLVRRGLPYLTLPFRVRRSTNL
ncbi:MAG: glycosyltransferase [Actinomycetota bacterium]